MNDKLEFPLFDGKETLTQFMRRVNDFDLRNKKPKYDIINITLRVIFRASHSTRFASENRKNFLLRTQFASLTITKCLALSELH